MQASETLPGGNEVTGSTNRNDTPLNIDDLPMFVQGLYANDQARQFQSCQQIRRLLSVESHPPIAAVIATGVVPRFVEFLTYHDRPDLQFESAWALTNIASGNQEQTGEVLRAGSIPHFLRLMENERADLREQAIWALGNISGDGPQFTEEVLRAGALPCLLRELLTVDQPNVRTSLIRYGTWTLSNFCRGKPELSTVVDALPVLRKLLYTVDVEILVDACWAISYLANSSEDHPSHSIDAVIESGVCARLIELLGHTNFLVQTPALRAVGTIVTGDDTQTQTMIAFGCLPRLKALLDSPRKALRKEACWAISNITAGNREQIEEVLNNNIIPDLVRILETAEFEVKREAAWAISNASSGGNTRQVAALVEAGCLKPLCDLLDVHDHRIISVALESIENILRTGKARMEEEGLPQNPYVSLLEEAGGFPKLEKLQYLPSKNKLQHMAVHVMTEYLDLVQDDDDDLQDDNAQGFGGMN